MVAVDYRPAPSTNSANLPKTATQLLARWRSTRLNQRLANAFGIPVIAAGSTEATALGSAFLQLVGLGERHTLAKIRAVAQRADGLFEPQAGWRAAWDEVAGRFAALA